MHIFTFLFYLIKANYISLLLNKQICLYIATDFAAFFVTTQFVEKRMLIFVRKGQNHKINAHCVKKIQFSMRFNFTTECFEFSMWV